VAHVHDYDFFKMHILSEFPTFCRLLRRGSMFVFSDKQLQQLLQLPTDYKGGNMIDLGILFK